MYPVSAVPTLPPRSHSRVSRRISRQKRLISARAACISAAASACRSARTCSSSFTRRPGRCCWPPKSSVWMCWNPCRTVHRNTATAANISIWNPRRKPSCAAIFSARRLNCGGGTADKKHTGGIPRPFFAARKPAAIPSIQKDRCTAHRPLFFPQPAGFLRPARRRYGARYWM